MTEKTITLEECKHTFHGQCVVGHFRSGDVRCPVCRGMPAAASAATSDESDMDDEDDVLPRTAAAATVNENFWSPTPSGGEEDDMEEEEEEDESSEDSALSVTSEMESVINSVLEDPTVYRLREEVNSLGRSLGRMRRRLEARRVRSMERKRLRFMQSSLWNCYLAVRDEYIAKLDEFDEMYLNMLPRDDFDPLWTESFSFSADVQRPLLLDMVKITVPLEMSSFIVQGETADPMQPWKLVPLLPEVMIAESLF
jgi:hypothetical protein